MLYGYISDMSLHKRIFKLTFPMIISNVTIPLLSIIDVAVVGHLEQPSYLGGVALGSTILAFLFSILSFLRMTVTGLTAQAYGQNNSHKAIQILIQASLIAFGLACLIIAILPFLLSSIIHLSQATTDVTTAAHRYALVRLYATPAVLLNYVCLGWLLGHQQTKAPVLMLLTAGIANIILDLLFVWVLHWQVTGIALATAISQYLSLAVGCYFVVKTLHNHHTLDLKHHFHFKAVEIRAMFALNRDMFIRSLLLQSTLALMTFYSASLSDQIIAANAILMNFMLLLSYAMDGLAYAVEVIIGVAIGSRDHRVILKTIATTALWGVVISLLFACSYFLFGTNLIDSMSDIEEVRQTAYLFLPWMITMPLIAMWAYLLDGIFIGAAKAKEMRNSMLISTVLFLVVFTIIGSSILPSSTEAGADVSLAYNKAMWSGFLAFMAARGLLLGKALIPVLKHHKEHDNTDASKSITE